MDGESFLSLEEVLESEKLPEKVFYVHKSLDSNDEYCLLKVEELDFWGAVDKAKSRIEFYHATEKYKEDFLGRYGRKDWNRSFREFAEAIDRDGSIEFLRLYDEIRGSEEYWIVPKDAWTGRYMTDIEFFRGGQPRFYARQLFLERPDNATVLYTKPGLENVNPAVHGQKF
jgi:hypothetical protein